MIPKVYLSRFPTTDQGTLGIWACPEFNFSCFSLELPWRNNQVKYSCIPSGEYIVVSRYSNKYKWHFHITNVKGRSWILLHPGNFAGDTLKFFRSHSQGCILLGKSYGTLYNQLAVLNSRITLRKFLNLLKQRTFKLYINEYNS